MLSVDDLSRLACPRCRGTLRFRGQTRNRRLGRGGISCYGCGAHFRVEDGLAHLYRDEEVRGSDRLMRVVYNGMAPLHNLAVRVLLPVFQQGTEDEFRGGYMPRLELGALQHSPGEQPLRILEVGIGAGANLPWLRRELPAGVPVEIWGCDLSAGMLHVLRRELRRRGERDIRLLFGDAHALPFPDHSFDRVFHVGGINGFRDPALAMEEMARVAKPGTPIVVVDEHLDPARDPNLYHRAMFKLVTWYDDDPHCPVEAVPPGAVDITQDQLSLFFFCLSFKMPVPGKPRV
ncbi:MAG: methyltransferase domain-containing protein [Hyalangium sp.]|uniref:methyltransferase domain-containing protein n=1 Tax=Hyalangium sp. TaxID=2028555 RepID=UPI003899ADB3